MKKYNIKRYEKIKLNDVGADASVRLEKNQNRNNIRTFVKSKSNAVGEASLGDPLKKKKHTNKPLSNIPTSNIRFPTSDTAITLIALIITIIVLLILAGVTLNMVMGENGLFGKANNAKNKTEVAQYEEELRMCVLEIQADEATNGTTFGIDTIRKNLVEKVKELENTEEIEITSPEGNATIEGTYKGYEYKIDEKYVVHIGDKATGIILTTSIEPKGWTNQNVTATITIKSNNGIKKVEPDEGSKNGNEYIITKENIAENTSFEYTVTDGQGNTQTKTAVINTIDKNAPADFTITAENTEEGLKITGETTDAESGIDRYEYKVTNITSNEVQTYTESLIKLPSGTYNVYVNAYDKAGNVKKSTNSVTDLKVQAVYKNVTAEMIAKNPQLYYGLTVTNYASVNGQDDWKIFYSDGTHIFLITSEYVKMTDENGNLDSNKLNENTKLTLIGKTNRVTWKSVPDYQKNINEEVDIKIKERFKANEYDIKNNSDNTNSKYASVLLNVENWKKYLDEENGERMGEFAVGGSTIEMWVDSWNNKFPNNKLYYNNINENGYYLGKSRDELGTRVSVADDKDFKLYINTDKYIDDVSFYLLSSPSAERIEKIYGVDFYNKSIIGVGRWENSVNIHVIAIRPVVSLNKNITVNVKDSE